MNVLPISQVAGDIVKMARTDPLHLGMDGKAGKNEQTKASGFEEALLKAMDGVNAKQAESTDITQRMMTDPDSVDAHDVTIAQAEANLSLNVARTVMDRVVKGWKELVNSR
jgi:flagellar hook-basal body complex protein FliE